MADDFDDLDFEDVNGGVDTIEENYYEDILLGTEPEITKEAAEWEDCITRLEKHCYKSWICIPHVEEEPDPPKLLLEIHEVSKCSDEKFFEWLKIAWPPTKNMDHKAGDYSKDTSRDAAINSVVGLHQVVRFPIQRQ